MNFKKMVPYTFTKTPMIADALLEHAAFTPCHGTQAGSCGFTVVPGTDKHLHIGDDFMYMVYTEEKRILPGAVINEFCADKFEEYEHREGYKPGRAIRRQIKDDVTAMLMPKAFTKKDHVPMMVIPSKALLLVFGTPALADNAIAKLRDAIGSLPVTTMQVKHGLDKTMANWLSEGVLPDDFCVGESAILMDRDKAKISTAKQELISDEVKTIIDAGKTVHMLEMSFKESVEFKLNEHFQILSLKFIGETDENEIEDPLSRLNHELGVACVWIKDWVGQLVSVFGGYQDEVEAEINQCIAELKAIDQAEIELIAKNEVERRVNEEKERREAELEAQETVELEVLGSANDSVTASEVA